VVSTDDIPKGLELPIDFVNTLDVEAGTDALAHPDDLASWLEAAGLLSADAPSPGHADLERAIELREALRSLMLANNGGPCDDRTGGVLESVARRGGLGIHFDRTGSVSIRPEPRGLDGALAALLIPIVRADEDGSWGRVKACRADDCRWAFYDRSRNRSGVWCKMAVCGNRTKVRAYRQRAPSRRS